MNKLIYKKRSLLKGMFFLLRNKNSFLLWISKIFQTSQKKDAIFLDFKGKSYDAQEPCLTSWSTGYIFIPCEPPGAPAFQVTLSKLRLLVTEKYLQSMNNFTDFTLPFHPRLPAECPQMLSVISSYYFTFTSCFSIKSQLFIQ